MSSTLDSHKDFGFDADVDEEIGKLLRKAASVLDDRANFMLDDEIESGPQPEGYKNKGIKVLRQTARKFRKFAEEIGV